MVYFVVITWAREDRHGGLVPDRVDESLTFHPEHSSLEVSPPDPGGEGAGAVGGPGQAETRHGARLGPRRAESPLRGLQRLLRGQEHQARGEMTCRLYKIYLRKNNFKTG